MAQSGYTPILIYASGTTTNVPLAANLTSSASGAELALNYVDGKLFYKDNAGVVQTLATKSSTSGVFTSVTDSGLTSGRVTYATTGGLLTDSANLTFNGTTLTANTIGAFTLGGTVAGGGNQINNVIIGTTTPLAGAFTTLSATGNANFGNAGSSTYGGYATGGRIFSLAAAGGVIPAISASTDTFASSTAIRAYTKETANDTSYAFDIQTGNGTGVTTQKLQLTWGANGLWSSTGLAVTGTLSTTAAITSGSDFKVPTLGYIYAYTGAGAGTVKAGFQFDGAGAIYGKIADTTITNTSSTGLAVTGTLSATGSTIFGSGATTTAINLYGTNTGGGLAIWVDNAAGNGIGWTGETGAYNSYIGTVTNTSLGFATNSSVRMLLNSSGNLGVGVTPSAWSTSNSTRAIQISSVGSIWGNVNSSSLNNNWYLASGDVSTYISTAPATRYVQDATGIHQWFYAASGTAGATMTLSEAMRIDTSGNLGIGTTSPGARLNVATAETKGQNATTAIFATSTGGANDFQLIFSRGTNTYYSIQSVEQGVANRSLIFNPSGGNVGIGTTSPNTKLEVVATTSSGAISNAVALTQAGSGSGTGTSLYIGYATTIGTYTSLSGFYDGTGTSLTFGTSSGAGTTAVTERMRLNYAGNLGLGVTPNAWPTGSNTIQASSSSLFGNTATLILASNLYYDSAYTPKYIGTNVAGCMQYNNGGVGGWFWFNAPSGTAGTTATLTQAMTLDNSGNLLVGTTSQLQSSRLSVLGSGNVGDFRTSSASGYPVVCENTATGSTSMIAFLSGPSTTTVGSITYNSGTGLTIYATTSDYRAKNITGAVNNSGALIDSTPVYMGKMKGATQERPMFIAHETPEYAHTGEKDAVDADGNPVYQQMDASTLIPVMWAELQSLRARVAQLETKGV